MFIKRILLKNFMSHLDSEIFFSNGINVIVGKNGSGKSTIIKAIFLCLLTLKDTGLKKEEIKNRWVNEDPKVILELIHNNKEIGLKYEKGKYFVKTKEKFFNYESNKYKEFIYENIYPKEIIENAIIILQEDIKKLSLDRNNRVSIIKKFIGIDDANDAIKVLTKLIHNLELKIKENNNLIEILSNEINKNVETELNHYLMEKEKILMIKEKLNKRILELKNTLSDYEKRINSLEKKFSQFSLLEKEFSLKNSRLCNLEKEIQRINNNYLSEEQYCNLKAKLELKEKYLRFKEKEKEVKNKLEKILEKIELNKYDQSILDNFNEIEKKYNEFVKLKSTIIEIEQSIFPNYLEKLNRLKELESKKINETISLLNYELRKNNDKIKDIENKKKEILNNVECPICKSSLNKVKKKKLLNDYDREINEIKLRNKNIEKKLEELKKLQEEYEKLKKLEKELIISKENHEKLNKLKKKLELLNFNVDFEIEKKKYFEELNKKNKYDLLIKEKESLEKELNQIINDTPSIDFNIDNLPTLKEIEKMYSSYLLLKKYENEKKELIEDLEKVKIKIDQIKQEVSDSNLEELRKHKYEIMKKYELEYQNMIKLNEKIGYLNSQIRVLEKELEKQKEINEKLNSFKEENQKNKKLRKKIEEDIFEIEEYLNYLKNQGLPEIVDIASNIFSRLSDYEFERLEYVQEENGDFDIYAVKKGEFFDPKSLSGGQQTIYSLSLRFAIGIWSKKTHDIDKINCIILDEPTIHLDDSAIERLRTEIETLKLDQIIIVTHDQVFPKIADNLYEVKIENGFSKIIKKN